MSTVNIYYKVNELNKIIMYLSGKNITNKNMIIFIFIIFTEKSVIKKDADLPYLQIKIQIRFKILIKLCIM